MPALIAAAVAPAAAQQRTAVAGERATPAEEWAGARQTRVAARSPPARLGPTIATAALLAEAEHGLGQRAVLEIAGVALTGAGHAVAEALDGQAVFLPVAVLAWGGYTVHRTRAQQGHLARLGLTRRALGPAFRDASLVAAGAAAAMAAIAASRGTLRWDADMIPLALLYPAWGVAQQTLVQGHVARNLAASRTFASPWLTVPATALLFGAMHLPDLELAGATTAMGLAYTPLYLKYGNTWPLGVWHGLLGVPFYFWILERDPLAELTGGG